MNLFARVFRRTFELVLAPLNRQRSTEPKPDPLAYGRRIAKVARSRVGERETGGRNRSPWIDMVVRSVNGKLGDEWCYAFAYWCCAEAAKRMAGETNIRPSRAAVKGWVASSANGAELILPTDVLSGKVDLRQGDVFICVRGEGPYEERVERARDDSLEPEDRWQSGHAGIVVDAERREVVDTAEGNSGPRADGVYQGLLSVRDPRLVGFLRPGLA